MRQSFEAELEAFLCCVLPSGVLMSKTRTKLFRIKRNVSILQRKSNTGEVCEEGANCNGPSSKSWKETKNALRGTAKEVPWATSGKPGKRVEM